MEATLFGSNQSWYRTLPISPGISRSRKYTVLLSPRTLGGPLSRQGLCSMREGGGKLRTNYSYIEDGQNFPPGGPYTTKSSILNIILPHTRIIRLGKIKACKLLGWLFATPPNYLNTNSATEGVGSRKIFPYNHKASRCHNYSPFLPILCDLPRTNPQVSKIQCYSPQSMSASMTTEMPNVQRLSRSKAKK